MRDRQNPQARRGHASSTRAGAGVTALGLPHRRPDAGGGRCAGASVDVAGHPAAGRRGARRLTRVHHFEAASPAGRRARLFAAGQGLPHRGRVGTGACPLRRRRAQTLLSMTAPSGGDLQSVVFAPKADGVLAVNGTGTYRPWHSTTRIPRSRSDALRQGLVRGLLEARIRLAIDRRHRRFEPKLSLTPLIFGTLKGTIYALLSPCRWRCWRRSTRSQFMHPR